MNIFQLRDGFAFAMHGAGAYFGCAHTNSREAFLFWQQKGIKICEIDVGIDEQYEEGLAFAHMLRRDVDWLQKEINPSLVNSDYKVNKIYPKSTPGLSIMLLSELFQYMKVDPDLLIMLDFFGGDDSQICCKLTQLVVKEIGGDNTLWDRLLIEVYTSGMIQVVKSVAPNANMIFGESDHYKRMTVTEVMSYGISFVSFPRNLAEKSMPKFLEYVNNGFTVFSLSASNLGWKKWKKFGANVNIIDIKYDSVFQVIKHFVYAMRHKLNVLRVYIDYYGIKKVTEIVKNKIFK